MSLELARDLVMAYGWNSTSYQILNPGIKHWFSSDARAVVGYTRRNGVLVVAGAPVCSQVALPSVCNAFEHFARRQQCRICYVCAEERLRDALARLPNHSSVALGAQPAWDPESWEDLLHKRPSLRAQLRRARNKGVAIEEVEAERGAADAELERVLAEWLRARRLPPLHFLVEPCVLRSALRDRLILVARRSGRAVAFLVASPVPAKKGYLIELLARSPSASNGTSELLIDAAMRRFAEEGQRYATLGLVALAHAADAQIDQNPWWLRNLMWFARAHANRFYNFRGLEQFRLKLAPERWETVYAIADAPSFPVRTLYAMGAAFSGISPWRALAVGAFRAVRQELRGAVNAKAPPWR